MNTFGRLLRMHLFGESHGQGVGAIVDGLPAGVPIEVSRIQAALDRRRPAQGPATSSRRETDQVEVLSGVYRGCSTAAPLALSTGRLLEPPDSPRSLPLKPRSPEGSTHSYNII